MDQDREGRHASQATRSPQGENPLHRAIALGIVGAWHQLVSEHSEPPCAVELSEGIAPPAGLQNCACHFRGTRFLR
jgi:hypothetical protein